MKKKITIRFMSVVLCLAMMFTCLQVSATALTLEDVEQVFNKLAHYTVDDLPKNLRRHLNSGWSRSTLDKADADNENVLTTVNADGTKTLYSYDSPIKFVDEEGYVRFIDSSLKPCVKADGLFGWYSYENTANDIKTYFPLFIKTGVLVEGEQGDIRMTPKDARNSLSSKVTEGNNEYVLYEDVFDKGVDIRYTAINEGVKEDIILEAYNGDNTFEYIVEAEGLTPVRNEGKTIEFIDGDMQTAYTLGEIVLFDSAEVPATNGNNSYTVEELKDGKYLVTLTVDEEFLTDENTVYPVIVDPSLSTHNTDSRIIATTYYSDGSTPTTSTNKISSTGLSPTAITHLQLADLKDYAHINPKEIITATLTLNFSSFSANDTTYIHAKGYENFEEDPSTSYASLSWSDVSSECTSTSDYCARVDDTVAIEIHDIFVEWMTAYTKYYSREDTVSAEDGLFLYARSYNSGVVNATMCSPDASGEPSIRITYTVDENLLESGYYYIQSGYYYDDARYMSATSTGVELRDRNYADPNQLWYVKRVDEVYGTNNDGLYYIYSVGTTKNDYLMSSGGGVIEWRNESSVPAGLESGTAFYIVRQTDRYHRVLTSGNDAVAAKNYNKANGTPIVHETVKGLDNQRWEFEPADYGVFPDGSTSLSGVVGENVPFHYSMAPVDADYSISIKDTNVAELVSYDRSHAYVRCKKVGSTDITVSFTMDSPITDEPDTYSCTWRLNVLSSNCDLAPGGYYITSYSGNKHLDAVTDTTAGMSSYNKYDKSQVFYLDYGENPNCYNIINFDNGYYLTKTSSGSVTFTETATELSMWRIVGTKNSGYKIYNYTDTAIYLERDASNSSVFISNLGTNCKWDFSTGCAYVKSNNSTYLDDASMHSLCLTPDASTNSGLKYECIGCSKRFKMPEDQDYDVLCDGDYVAVTSLMDMALKELAHERIAAAETCLKAIDYIRNSYPDAYECSDYLGNYTSLYEYEHTPQTASFRLDANVSVKTEQVILMGIVVYNADAFLPPPYNIVYASVRETFVAMGKNEFTLSDILIVAGKETIKTIPKTKKFQEYLKLSEKSKKIIKIVSFLSSAKAIYETAKEFTIDYGAEYFDAKLTGTSVLLDYHYQYYRDTNNVLHLVQSVCDAQENPPEQPTTNYFTLDYNNYASWSSEETDRYNHILSGTLFT